MITREQRVAWLLNHTSLREAELPLIRNLGFELYTSKLLPDTSSRDFRNQSADYEDDRLSTLPSDVLAILNTCRWYEQQISHEAAALLNTHFGTVICSQHPVVLRNVLQHYKGRILLRAFGFPGHLSYGEYYSRREQRDILEGILKVKERFWFTPFYESVARFEQDVFGERAKVLPIGLPPHVVETGRIWTGDDPRILFVCPSIQTDPYYHGPQYGAFKANFGDLPHTIVGYQEIPVPDTNVIGYVSQDKLRDLFAQHRVLFYPSREARHIQYHPFEAAVYGMPVIYFKGNLLHELAGGGNLPGSCGSYEESRVKLQRILSGDKVFISEVLDSQKRMADRFLPDHVRVVWQQNFVDGIMTNALPQGEPVELPTLSWQVESKSYTPEKSKLGILGRKISTALYEAVWIGSRWLKAAFSQRRLIPYDTGIKVVVRHNQMLKRLGKFLTR